MCQIDMVACVEIIIFSDSESNHLCIFLNVAKSVQVVPPTSLMMTVGEHLCHVNSEVSLA